MHLGKEARHLLPCTSYSAPPTLQVLLAPPDDEDDGDEEALTRPALRVTLDVNSSAYANARSYYGQTKAAAAKTSKTLEAAG